jgi:hypothetical protein
MERGMMIENRCAAGDAFRELVVGHHRRQGKLIADLARKPERDVVAAGKAARTALDVPGFCVALDLVRGERSLAWKDVAAATGVSASTLARMRRHGTRPDVDGFVALLRWLGLPADSFYATTD